MLKLTKNSQCFPILKQILNLYKSSHPQCLLSKFNSQLNSETNFHTSTTSYGRHPRLLYIQNPFRWLQNKVDLKLFQLSWDRTFVENEFKRGVAQV